MIADYAFYVGTYSGTTLSEADFRKYATRADSYLQELTMGRYADGSLGDNVKDAVKMAECEIAEQCYAAEQIISAGATLGSGVLASESVGAHSVSYRSGGEVQAETYSSIRRVATRWLGTTGLLYRGIPWSSPFCSACDCCD